MSGTNRRGFLGLLGAASAAMPFLGNAVALKVDQATGALTIDGPKDLAIEPMANLPAGDFLIIPAHCVRSVQAHHHIDRIDVTRLDDDARQYVRGMQNLVSLDVRIEADHALALNLYHQFSSALSKAR